MSLVTDLKGADMDRTSTPRRALRAVRRMYREMDYVNRRSLELRTGLDLVDPWERLARAPRSPRRP